MINDQVWMAENLAYLPAVSSPITDQLIDHKYYYINGYLGNNVQEAKQNPNYSAYGVLYNWNAAMDACPEGWHLASDDEWQVLEKQLGMSESQLAISGLRNSGSIGKKMKSKDEWFEEGNGTNSAGLNFRPGGLMEQTVFKAPGKVFWTWTSTKPVDGYPRTRYIMYNEDGINRYSAWTSIAGIIRCLKDESLNEPPMAMFSVSPSEGPNTTHFVMDASGCSDDLDATENLQIRWDFDYEGREGWDTEFSTKKTANCQYESYHRTYIIRLEVKDSEGLTNVTDREVVVSNVGTMVDGRGDKTYKTILIGNQTWMSENLAAVTFRNGDPIPEAATSAAWQTANQNKQPAWCNFENDPENGNNFGKLYNWYAINDPRGLGPEGWHVSSEDE